MDKVEGEVPEVLEVEVLLETEVADDEITEEELDDTEEEEDAAEFEEDAADEDALVVGGEDAEENVEVVTGGVEAVVTEEVEVLTAT